jgi:hypothetical protein
MRHIKRYLPTVALGAVLLGGGWPALAQSPVREVQLPTPPTTLVGTWRSGNFAYTFFDNGTYVYVGAMGNTMMRTQTSEEGTYAVSGDKLIVQRQRGILMTSQNYRQDLGPQTTVFQWRLGNTQSGLALQLVYPTGGAQMFYKQ